MRHSTRLGVPALLLAALVGFAGCAQRYDIVIESATIYDGSGGEPFAADLGIKDGRIQTIGEIKPNADVVIDARNFYVAPGFIDIHNHAVFSESEREELSYEPDWNEMKTARNYLTQGVTTVVSGNCGSGPHTVKELFEHMRQIGIGVNVIELVGHGTVRRAVMGMEDRAPTAEEMERMKQMVAEAMEGGAAGLSTGLFYPPGCYAKTAEVIELARLVREYGGIYASHVRDEGTNDMGGVLASMQEAVRIGKEAGVPVQIAHLKAGGKPAWGMAAEITAVFEEAQSSGLRIYADQYPYTAGSTNLASIVLPRWFLAGGKLKEKVIDPALVARVRAEVAQRVDTYGGAEAIVIAYSSKKPEWVGKNVQQLSQEMALSPADAAIEMFKIDDPQVVVFMMKDEDMEYFMKKPYVMTSSDGLNVPYGIGQPHPRNYGAFTRKIRVYVLDRKLISMEQAIRAATSLPAEMLGLEDRGRIQEGYAADLVVFDPRTIRDRATYTEPHQYSEGIEYVLVNGRVAIDKGTYNGTLAGQPLPHRPGLPAGRR